MDIGIAGSGIWWAERKPFSFTASRFVSFPFLPFPFHVLSLPFYPLPLSFLFLVIRLLGTLFVVRHSKSAPFSVEHVCVNLQVVFHTHIYIYIYIYWLYIIHTNSKLNIAFGIVGPNYYIKNIYIIHMYHIISGPKHKMTCQTAKPSLSFFVTTQHFQV